MNRFALLAAFVVACAGVALAHHHGGKFGGGKFGGGYEEEDIDVGVGVGPYGGYGSIHEGSGYGYGGGLGSYNDELLFDELHRRGHRGWRRGGRLRGGYGKRHHRHHYPKLGHGPVVGGSGFGGAGIRGSEASFGGLNSRNHLGSSNFAEGQEASLVAGQNKFNAGSHNDDFHDNEGLRKHQVINKDKTIIKDRTTGVNDVDGFRNVDAHSSGNHIGSSQSGIAAQEASGAVGNRLNVDRDVNAFGGQASEIDASVL